MTSFQSGFKFVKQEKVCWGWVQGIGWMGHNRCLMFWQITADEERRVSQCIVVVRHPSVVFPHFRALAAHSIPSNVLKHPGTTVCLPSDHMVQIHDGQCLSNQKHNQHHLDLWLTYPCFFWSRRLFPHPLRQLHLGFNIIPINPHLISCYDVLKKVFITICIGNSSWLISTRFSFWLSFYKRGRNFAMMRRIWSFSVKIWWQDPVVMPTSSATSWTAKQQFPQITAWTL